MPFILPDPVRKLRLRSIQQNLAAYKVTGDPSSLAAAAAHIVADPPFQAKLRQAAELRKPLRTETEMLAFAWSYWYSLMMDRDLCAAAMMLWDEETFTPEPHCVQQVWNAILGKRMIGIIGAGAQSKSYSAGAYCLLEWVFDPEWTRIQLASTSEDHVLKNLYAGVIQLHQESSLQLPGVPNTAAISLDAKRGFGIFTLVLPGGPLSKGKVKGTHTKPRPKHPLFGRRSRNITVIDEAQEVPQNIFGEIQNRFSGVDGSDTEHIKFIIAANPKDIYSEFGACLKPVGGWDKIEIQTESWDSQHGWHVVSLNAMNSENVRQRRTIYPGLATYEGVQGWLKKCNGDPHHPLMYTYVYGKFPPAGTQSTIIPQQRLSASEGEWIFDSPAKNGAGHDPAFTGDQPAFAVGRLGRAIAWVDFEGNRHDLKEPRMAIQLDGDVILPRGDTQELADENMLRLKELHVPADHYAIDRTGSGQGVHDVIRHQWGQKVWPVAGMAPIIGVHYGGSPTEVKVAEEDTQTPAELYYNIATELWYAAAKLFEYDCIRIGRTVTKECLEELSARCGGMKVGGGKKLAVESKDIYKARTGSRSPDRADATLLLLHAFRMTEENLIPKAKDTVQTEEPRPPREWGDSDLAFHGATLEGMNDGAMDLGDTMRD